jgi:hypothetical protein
MDEFATYVWRLCQLRHPGNQQHTHSSTNSSVTYAGGHKANMETSFRIVNTMCLLGIFFVLATIRDHIPPTRGDYHRGEEDKGVMSLFFSLIGNEERGLV